MDFEERRINENGNSEKSFESGNIREKENATLVNGMANGYNKEHKSEHKDKHRDREKDKHRSDKEKHKHSSSKSSYKDKDRDKARDHSKEKKSGDEKKSYDKEREHKSSSTTKDSKSSSKDKHHSSSSSSSNKEKEKERHSSSHRDKDKHSSSTSSSSSSKKDKDKHSSQSKDREKHHSSSSSSKDKYNSSSSKDKDRHKDKSKESKDKDKSKSSSHSEHHRDKSKDKTRDKDRKEKDRERERPRENERSSDVEVKQSKEESTLEFRSYPDSADSATEEETLRIDEDCVREECDGIKIKEEKEESEDDIPLTMRAIKREIVDEDDEDETPLFARLNKKIKKEDSEDEFKPTKKTKGKKRKSKGDSDTEDDFKPTAKKVSKSVKKEVKKETTTSPKKIKKEEEQQEVWKWWEEEKRNDGTKWKFLEHKGPLFAPLYERLPGSVKFYYDGNLVELSEAAEEVATFYAKMLNHDYTTKEKFNSNFFKDWRKVMTDKERKLITDLTKCNFKPMADYFTEKSEERKAMSKEEKKVIKEQNDAIQKEYGFCTIDGHTEKIGNFRIEPPGLFRGRGEHPKMGMLKKRVMPEDVIINCSSDSKIPKPPDGHRWKKVQHDPSVTWLASWTENVQGNVKYVMLNPSSKLKGEKDMVKYETARKLAKKIEKIREQYQLDWKSKEMKIRQRAVALYFIDKLALRAGNEKDEDQADTVGCCSLRVEHVELHPELNGMENVVVFDFLGKDSIRYYNEVPVERRVFKNLLLFKENKQPQDDLFDRLNTSVLNKHLNELMDGLTAKVFRTYNASWTLQEQLNELTNPNDTVAEKLLAYNRANRAVAILCNHQRSVPKSHEKSMENLKAKIEAKKDQISQVKKELKDAKRNREAGTEGKKKKQLERLKEQLLKLEVQETDKEENKTIALGTSKLNYLDPRISVAWCKKYNVPIEKIYNKTQRDKFRWAIDMAGPEYVF
ncbi:hypothetical protein RUM44_006912 [Polyplax serrata]|uniref:DNA topoisomerase I n=1 Tax=Polyplax serrata TaxID=468196 RepID=A0ABR1AZ96_POLSC